MGEEPNAQAGTSTSAAPPHSALVSPASDAAQRLALLFVISPAF